MHTAHPWQGFRTFFRWAAVVILVLGWVAVGLGALAIHHMCEEGFGCALFTQVQFDGYQERATVLGFTAGRESVACARGGL